MTVTLAYILIITAALLCSCQFLAQRGYNKTEGRGVFTALVFSAVGSIISIVAALAIYGFEHTVAPGSVALSLLSGINCVLITLFSAKVFLVANMSVYSMFMMLGGMALPFVFGICIGEDFTWGKAACFVLIVIASLINTDLKSKSSRGAIKYYIGIFVCNGLSGVLAAANQNLSEHSSGGTYMLLLNIWRLAICALAVIIMVAKTKQKIFASPKSAVVSSTLYGVLSALSSLFIFISLEALDASVQYPMITGGTMVFSVLICFICREKVSLRDVIAVLVATASSVVVIL